MATAQEGSDFYVQGNRPPGYRFKPTEKELLYYLNLKILNKHIPIDAIKDIDLYQYHPHDLCQSTRDGKQEGYFFTSRTKKYRKGCRPDRTASDGYWKATGGDVIIESNGQEVGRKKVLVYYERKSENNKGTKTNWIMHEFTIHQRKDVACSSTMTIPDDKILLDECVCRIYNRTSSKNKKEDMIPIQETDHVPDANLAAALINDDQYPFVHEPVVTYMHGDHMAMQSNILQSLASIIPDHDDQIISNDDPNLMIPTHEPAGMQHMDGDLVVVTSGFAASTGNDGGDDDDDCLDLTTLFDSSPEMGPKLLDSVLVEYSSNAQSQSWPIEPAAGQSITLIHDMEASEVGGSASASGNDDGDNYNLNLPSSSILEWPLGTWISHLLQ